MRALPILLFVVATSPAGADSIRLTDQDGSPAIEGKGASSTTISAVGGAASVTVKGSGALSVHSNSGKISGSGSLGVPELGVSLGGALANSTASEQSAEFAVVGAVPPGLGTAGEVGAAAPGDCTADLPTLNVDVAAVERFNRSQGVTVIASCTVVPMIDDGMIEAIADNRTLVAALSAKGYRADDVIALDIATEGNAVLFVAAD